MDERESWKQRKQRKQRKSDTKWRETIVKGFLGVQFERVLKFMHGIRELKEKEREFVTMQRGRLFNFGLF